MNIGETKRGSVYELTQVDATKVMFTDTGYISAGDGLRYEHLEGIAGPRTRQTVAMLTLLKESGVATAFMGPKGPVTFLQKATSMLQFEVVVRLARMGSWLERNPGEKPHWGKAPMVEFFHKKTLDLRGGVAELVDGNIFRAMDKDEFRALKGKTVFPDPYITMHSPEAWGLHNAHAEVDGTTVPLMEIKPIANMAAVKLIRAKALDAYCVLAASFNRLDCKTLGIAGLKHLPLADIKFEFGHDETGDIVLSDVVNLDSLRLLKNGGFAKEDQLSKQIYRDDRPVADVLKAYEQGAVIAETLLANHRKRSMPARTGTGTKPQHGVKAA